jgi:5-(carboxyamino)imidazole ribonucleotide mutase
MARDVLVLMGSQSDAATMKHTCDMLMVLGISHDSRITSAHRTPQRMFEAVRNAAGSGFKVIIAGAGGSAHLPGMSASETYLPVIGVAVLSQSSTLNDDCAVGSMIGMPEGVPLLFAGFGKAGAKNAALAAARILATSDLHIQTRLTDWIKKQTSEVPETPDYDPKT